MPFFNGMGFALPARKGIADFLQEVGCSPVIRCIIRALNLCNCCLSCPLCLCLNSFRSFWQSKIHFLEAFLHGTEFLSFFFIWKGLGGHMSSEAIMGGG